MAIDILNTEGKKVTTVDLNSEVFTGKVNDALIYDMVKMQRANKRSGTASTKTRSEIQGSNAKPWKQKGTGRARAGTKKSPLWRSGGTVFGPKPRDYSYSMNKKMAKGALISAIQYKANEGQIKIFDELNFDAPKTKQAVELFEKNNISKALIVIDGENKNLELSVRNLYGSKVIRFEGLNVYDVLYAKDLVFTKSSFEKLESLSK